jgi:predicted ArsR family transcriptional regulator
MSVARDLDLDEELLYQLHVENGLSGNQIAKRLGIHPTTAVAHLRRMGIYDKSQSYGKESQNNLPE